MDLLRWARKPDLRRPILVFAFEGWNDAGDAASLALSHLTRALDAEPLATIDSEELYDFTVTRPQVRLVEGERIIAWPHIELLGATVPGSNHDLMLMRGVEPQLHWRTFADAVVTAGQTVKAELAVALGALLADVPHTRPVRVSGTSDDQELAARLGLVPPEYEGPTGIVGVLHDALRRGGIPTAMYWAAVPHYVHQLPSPKAALALVERSAALLGAPIDLLELQAAALDYEREVSERIADDEDAAAYVAQLEEATDTSWDAPGQSDRFGSEITGTIDELAAEVERFLRDHPQTGRGD